MSEVDELRTARLAQIAAEGRALELQSLVKTLERQRDHADGLLLNLTAASQEFLMPSRNPAYVAARRYVCSEMTLDKYERRFIEPDASERCDCVTLTNIALRETDRNAKVLVNLADGRPVVATVRPNGKPGPLLFASNCPFCGIKYGD